MTGLLQLATTGTVSGLQNNQAANSALAALAGMIQGGSAPTPASTGLASTAGVWWHDTTNNQVKLRDQADANWLPVASLDETNRALMVLLRSYLAGFISPLHRPDPEHSRLSLTPRGPRLQPFSF